MKRYYFLLSLIIFSYCLSEDEYYTYDRIVSTLEAWQDTFGFVDHNSSQYQGFGIIYELVTIGESSQDKLPIYAVKLSANVQEREAEPKVLILGQCHAEEIYGVEITMEIIKQFLHPEEYSDNRPYLQRGLASTEIWIVPTYNPEGLKVVHGWNRNGEYLQDYTYRKNIRDVINPGIFDYNVGIGNDSDGVDLNRNYDFNWSFGDTLIQPCSGSTCTSYPDDYDYYKGVNSESETETQAIVDLATEEQFLLSIAYHSSRSGRIDRYIIYPWAWKDKCDCDVTNLKQHSPGFNVIELLGAEIAEIATSYHDQDYQHTGTSYRKGNAQDWFYRETGCIQYLVEVGHSDTDNNIYGEGLLIEPDYMNEVIHSNIDAFFHLLMRAAGNNYNSVDGNQVRGIISDATGVPISNAIITIPELENVITKPRLSDKTGFYARILHPESSYTMFVSAFGYESSDTIEVEHLSSSAIEHNIGLIPLPNYEITFYIETPNIYDGAFQLIRHHIFQSDTFSISSGDTKSWSEGDYKLIINGNGYMTNVINIELYDDMVLYLDLLYKNNKIKEDFNLNSSGTWKSDIDGDEIIIPLEDITIGDSLIIEINFKYELEWDYDYFIIEYINANETTEIKKFTGDNYEYHTEYIPFTIPQDHSYGNLYLHLDQDDSWANKYRGVEIDYINIIKGSEIYMQNAIDVSDAFPGEFQLHQNYPNPFNPTTYINFYVPYLSPVSISIFDIRGELIEKLVDDIYKPGHYTTHLDAEEYASGIYLYHMEVKNVTYTRKFIYIK